MSSTGSNRNLTIVITLLAVVAVGIGYFALQPVVSQKPFKSSDTKQVDDDIDEDDDEENEVSVQTETIQDDTSIAAAAEEAKKLEELKSSYDDVCRVASKLLAGGAFERAAEKYSEALELARQIPTVSKKDVITLYNNRSAMYEKLGEFQKALSDITVVLAVDNKHIKARGRRGRIFEAQGKLKESIQEFALNILIEQSQGIQNQDNIPKIDELAKSLAREQCVGIIAEMRNPQFRRSLPSKAYMKNFFNLLVSTYDRKEKYQDADQLVQYFIVLFLFILILIM